MSGLSRSLFARNLILFLGMFFVAQIIAWVLFLGLVQRQRMEHLVSYIVAQTQVLRVALEQQEAAPEKLIADIDALASADRPLIRRQEPQLAAGDPGTLVSWFLGILQDHLAAGQAARWQGLPAPVLWVRTPVSGLPDCWIGFPMSGFTFELAPLLAALFGVSVLVALAGAGVIQFALLKPLRVLQAAAEGVRQGRQVQPVAGGMPVELARVAQAFDQMHAAQCQQEAERSLMLAGISHDLRTPLTKVWLGVEMLRGQGGEPEVLDRIEAGVRAADHIVGQFIDFVREPGGENWRDDKPCAVIAETARAIITDPDQLHLACVDADEPARIPADALRRIVANLVENAQRYGRPPVCVTVERDGDQLWLHVDDSGDGIPPSFQAQAMQPFRRLSSVGGGSGLGLSIVAKMLARLHGELRMSTTGEGRFRVSVRIPIPVS
jgi:two-component system, OmpR family, osmolarity sensor histidine kinase EnvZ